MSTGKDREYVILIRWDRTSTHKKAQEKRLLCFRRSITGEGDTPSEGTQKRRLTI